MKKYFIILLPFLILILAAVFRLYGINWDANFHLHPDERFLTMVGTAMKIPVSIEQYFNPNTTTLSPYNTGFDFYVYGVFPIVLTKIAAIAVHMDSYNGITIVGRIISALFDLGTLIFLYRIVLLFERKIKINSNLKYATIFIYALSVLPIQQSHFFTVDSFLVFFAMGALYFSLLYYFNRAFPYIFYSSVFFAFAIACKISAIYILPLLLFFMVFKNEEKNWIKKFFGWKQIIHIGAFLIISYVFLRIISPQLFESSSFFQFSLHDKFINSISQLKTLAGPSAGYFPPAIQWFTKPFGIFGIQNIIFFGLGVFISLFVLIGLFHIFLNEKKEIKIIILWMLFFVGYQTIQFAPSMRYFYIVYPTLVLCAGYGMIYFLKGIHKKYFKTALIIIIIGTIIWPLGFISIYGRPHSRVIASKWMYQNIPAQKSILTEHWDDGLPLSFPDHISTIYSSKQMPVFNQDTPEKWNEMNALFEEGDYIIFSSNRGYGTITPNSKMYPETSKWYRDLFDGKKKYKKITEFVSYPQWCLLFTNYCVSYPDQWSEEAFTVYDHPKVTIFKKS